MGGEGGGSGPSPLTDNDRRKKPQLPPPAGPSASLLPSCAPAPSRRSPRSVPPVRTTQNKLSHHPAKERRRRRTRGRRRRRRRPPQPHLQPCKHSRPLVSKAVHLHRIQLLLRALLIHHLLHLPVKFFLIVVFLLPRSFAASFRNDKMLP